jgi:hypothetical protein
MAILQSDGVNNATDLILRRNGTEGLRLTSSTVQLQSINNGPLAGFRNAIINGNFDIWQRGTSFTGSGYGADRWIFSHSGTTKTATRQSFTLGQTAVPGEPQYFCRHVVSSVAGAGNFCILRQYIESVRTFADRQVTVSFWANADASRPIAVELIQNFGSGGSPSTTVTGIGTTKVTLSTGWQKITVTATIPSISGKTIGSNDNDWLGLFIWFDAGSNFNSRTDSLGHQSGTFNIAQVQVEAGPVATPFERRPIGTELALCQRYFEKAIETANLILHPPARSTYATTGWLNYFFKVTKRTNPNVTATFVNLISTSIAVHTESVRFTGTSDGGGVGSIATGCTFDAEI